MKTIILTALIAGLLTANSLDRFMLGENKFTYEGYTLERNNTDGQTSFFCSISLKKGDEFIRKFPAVEVSKKELLRDFTAFGFANLLKKEGKKELIVKASLNGDTNKYFYWVYSLVPDFKLLFDTEKWKTGYVLGIDDFDNDGVKELIQTNLTFDAFDRCSHANSPVFDILFKYDAEKGEYYPANYMFKNMIAADDWVKEAKLKKDRDGLHLGSVLKSVLPLLYSGQEKEAWKYFEKEYAMGDKWVMMEKIKKKLETDPVYVHVRNNAPFYGTGQKKEEPAK